MMLIVVLVVATAMVLLQARENRRRVPRTPNDAIRRLRGPSAKVWVIIGLLLFVCVPIGTSWIGIGRRHLVPDLLPFLPLSDFGLSVLIVSGIYAVGALGLNVLIGYTGEVSFGHAAFAGVGAYLAGYLGGPLLSQLATLSIGGSVLPTIIWLPLVAVGGALISALTGPFALRLQGNYLAIVSLAVLAIGQQVFTNWQRLTGGASGRTPLPNLGLQVNSSIGIGTAFRGTAGGNVFGTLVSRNQVYFWMTWALVALCCLLVANLVRTRQGRAMMATRDHVTSAALSGVGVSSTKIRSFALSGALVAVSGAMYGSFVQSVAPNLFGLQLSIQFLVMVIVGGLGSVGATVAGATLVTALPLLINNYGAQLAWVPFLQTDPTKIGLNEANLVNILYGLAIVLLLVFQPSGLAGAYDKAKGYLRRWPMRR